MGHDLNKAIKDICCIKDIIEKSKVRYRGFAKVGILFGIYHLAESALDFSSIYVSEYIYIVSILKIVLLAAFLGCYMHIYGQEKQYTNQYYLSLLCIWGMIGIMVPVMMVILDMICFMLRKNCGIGFVGVPVEVVLYAVFLVVCAYVTAHRNLIYVSFSILFGYFLLNMVWPEQGIGIPAPMSVNAKLSFSFIYYIIVVCGGYICMGIYLWKRENNDN